MGAVSEAEGSTLPYRLTRVANVPRTEFAELRARGRAALASSLQWRHHAVGMLQAYVAEDVEPEVRLHIWHPGLVRTSLALDGGRPHDHRFGLRSTVLAGGVGHEELHVEPVADREPAHWVEYTVQHARAGAAPLVATGRRLRSEGVVATIHAGGVHEFPARAYHRSSIREFAVTLVTKLAQTTAPARVLFPEGCPPVFGVAPITDADAEPYVRLARAALAAGGAGR